MNDQTIQTTLDKIPTKKEVFDKWMMIYNDNLAGATTLELSRNYELERNTIRDIIRYSAIYIDLDLNNREKVIIAKHKALKRIEQIKKLIEDVNDDDDPDFGIANKHKVVLGYLKEIRHNEELAYKLDGLLKIDYNKFVDNRKIVIVHNIGKDKKKEEKIIDIKATSKEIASG